jgi:isopentenyl-diphosphate Delta-isomerase
LIASGGLRTGLDVARAIALGANLGGMALPLFRAQQEGGVAGAKLALDTILTTLRHALVLTGSRDTREFQSKPKIVVGELKDWLSGL